MLEPIGTANRDADGRIRQRGTIGILFVPVGVALARRLGKLPTFITGYLIGIFSGILTLVAVEGIPKIEFIFS